MISQKGSIPEWARVLVGTGSVDPAINGIQLTSSRAFEGSYAYWDVRDFAGKEGELSFTFRWSDQGAGPTINIFGFSSVPEPSVCVLLCVGGVAVIAAQNRRTKRL